MLAATRTAGRTVRRQAPAATSTAARMGPSAVVMAASVKAGSQAGSQAEVATISLG
jgi:hypothetical protein